jgi:hypothetical protein
MYRAATMRSRDGTTTVDASGPIVRGSLNRSISTQLGSGGPLVRVATTNGGVHIAER